MSDWLSDLGGLWRKAVHDVKEQLQMPGPNMFLGNVDPVLIRFDRSRPLADVTLDADAQQWLAPTWNRPPPDAFDLFVLLCEPEGGDGNQIPVYINEHRLGTLTAIDSADFRSVLAAATAAGKPLIGTALRDRDAGGKWALHVYRPEPSE